MKKITSLDNQINEWNSLQTQIEGLASLLELDDGSLSHEIEQQVDDLEKLLDKKQTTLLLSGEYDQGNAILAIHAGAGGTDSQDWAGMLERMYLRWAENSGYKTEILDRTPGEEAGVKSVTISVSGEFVYGY